MTKAKAKKFVQINATNSTLNALDEGGVVWAYIGNAYGWRPMNMTRLTVKQSIEAANRKYSEARTSIGVEDDN